jgi:hypothetical protein
MFQLARGDPLCLDPGVDLVLPQLDVLADPIGRQRSWSMSLYRVWSDRPRYFFAAVVPIQRYSSPTNPSDDS